MSVQGPAELEEAATTAAPSPLHDTVRRFAESARAAASTAHTEAKAHPLETVTGAFGVGYLIGRALFGRRR